MRCSRKPLPIPQYEFPFMPDTFRLYSEVTQDGDRVAREREQAEQARQKAEAAQAALFPPNPNPQPSTQ